MNDHLQVTIMVQNLIFYNNYLFFIINFMFKNILLKARTTLILLKF